MEMMLLSFVGLAVQSLWVEQGTCVVWTKGSYSERNQTNGVFVAGMSTWTLKSSRIQEKFDPCRWDKGFIPKAGAFLPFGAGGHGEKEQHRVSSDVLASH
ncbi:unnamed protein product [Eruca vesicaria subsp. sativa]|uniref:Uncharacterized protein n=1 Tax=Eruca vesicaria subsp. sativa TaxID=29727 RepID=A0ABC8ISB3_ERUVS|nr:unnamed protein product [Eruca vesicaria subsp. sativa]